MIESVGKMAIMTYTLGELGKWEPEEYFNLLRWSSTSQAWASHDALTIYILHPTLLHRSRTPGKLATVSLLHGYTNIAV